MNLLIMKWWKTLSIMKTPTIPTLIKLYGAHHSYNNILLISKLEGLFKYKYFTSL